MCPGIAVKGGGGGNGDGDGDGNGNGDDANGNGNGDGDGASGDDKNGGCAEGDPICPITGRMFLKIYDFGFSGPMPLRFLRNYSSRSSNVAGEFGFGWSHAYGWRVRVRRQCLEVYDEDARRQVFDSIPAPGETVENKLGWVLSRQGEGYSLRVPREGLIYRFGATTGDGWHHLASVSDRNGNTVVVERDPAGVLVQIIDSAGRPIRFVTDPKGRILLASVPTEPTQQRWMELARYTYDDEGNLATATDAEGYIAHYTYDRHLMVEHRSVSGLSYFYRYDGRTADAWCVESWGEFLGKADPALAVPIPPRPASGPDRRKVKGIHHVRLTYMKKQRYTEVQDPLGGVTRYFGDELGRAVKIVDPAGGVTERIFDPKTGGLVSESDTTAEPRRIAADASGDAGGYLGGDGDGVTTFHDDDGTEVTYYDDNDAIVRRRYDSRGNLEFLAHPDGTSEEWVYDERGLLVRWINRQGGVTTYVHDAMGCCTQVRYPDGAVEDQEYDYLGRRVVFWDEATRKTEFVWDRRSECVLKRYPDGTEARAVYDANRKIVELEECGRISRIEYGGIGWPTRVERPGGDVTEYRYDTLGNLVSVKNGRGQVFKLERDRHGRVTAFETFEGVRKTVGWNVAGEQTFIESVLGRIDIERDDRQRVKAMATPDQDLTFEYGKDGVFKLDNGLVALEQKLDQLGRVVLDKQGEHENRVSWGGGKVTAIASDVGLPLELGYGLGGDISTIRAGSAEIKLHEPAGTDRLTWLGDHLVLRRTYGNNGHLVRQALARRSLTVPASHAATSADPGLLFWASYEYDPAHYLRREYRSDGRTIEYELDAAGRIVEKSVHRGERVESREQIAYDAAGTPRMPGARYDLNMRPFELNGETFEYDVLGRLVRRLTDAGEWRYEWNSLDQLVRATAPDRVIEIDYDARGRRMKKRVLRQRELVSSTTWVWTNDAVLHEVDDLSGASRTYLRSNDDWTVLGHVDVRGGAASPVYYVNTPSGGIDFAVDETGKVVWAAAQTVYGHATPAVSTVEVTQRFVNQSWDADLELVYNRHRWYEPRLGLFISSDPFLLDGNFNPRDYAPNPSRFVDPLGAMPHPGVSNNPPPADSPCGKPNGVGGLDGNYMSGPGHWATDGTPSKPGYADCPAGALNKGSGFGSAQDTVDAAGKAYGCHSCGSKTSGYKDKNHWCCDHQPPRSTYSKKNAGAKGNKAATSDNVRLYPHCKNCANKQGGVLNQLSKSEKVAKGKKVMAANDP
jgi:RHS repeat-associated protein